MTRSRSIAGAAVLLALAACGGSGHELGGLSDAAVPGPPDAAACGTIAFPTVEAPLAGAVDVTAENLVVRASAFTSDGALRHVASEFQLWRLAGSGTPRELVWVARKTTGDLTTATLADGVLGSALEPFGRYAVRVTYGAAAAGCAPVARTSTDVVVRVDDGSSAFFDPSQIRSVALELSPETIKALNDQALPPVCGPLQRTYHPGTVILDGVRYEGVGVATKGGCGSSRTLDEKAAFKVKLDWDDPEVPGCPAERRHAGQSLLTLNNMVQDPSLSHERLGYAFYAALGVPVPRAATVRLTVNGQDWGLYLNLESYTGRFLARRFASNDGMMYEGEGRCELVAASALDGDAGCLSRSFTRGPCEESPDEDEDPQDFMLARELIAELDELPGAEFYPAITRLVAWDTFLAMWAAETMVWQWDGYVAARNNYRLYHDPSTGLWTFLPGGIDQAMSSYDPVSPFAYPSRLTKSCVAVKACKAAFRSKLVAALATYRAMDLDARRLEIVQQLEPELTRSAGRGPSRPEFILGHTQTGQFLKTRARRVETWLVDDDDEEDEDD